MKDQSLLSLTRETFAGRLGERFALRLDERAELELALIEANKLGGESDQREPYSLIFLGPLEPVLEQSIYALEHAELGTLEIFLVPVGPDKKKTGIQYEAVFS